MRVRPGRWWVVALAPLLLSAADPARLALPPPPPKFALPSVGVLFADDFSQGLAAWQADEPGVWSVAHGMLRAELPDQKQLRSVLRAGGPEWQDYALDFDVCMMRGVDKGAVVRLVADDGVGIDLRGGTYQDVVAYIGRWFVGQAETVNSNAAWHHLRIEVRGDHMVVRVNGELRIDRSIARAPRGGIALAAYTGGTGECTVYYDNVIVTRL